jgi:hypothetical protein
MKDVVLAFVFVTVASSMMAQTSGPPAKIMILETTLDKPHWGMRPTLVPALLRVRQLLDARRGGR